MLKTKVFTNFDFHRLAKYLPVILSGTKIFSHLGAKTMKDNILRGGFAPLKESTLKTRRVRGIEGVSPLLGTGRLYTSIKDTPDGVQMLRYGRYQHQGFVPKKVPYKSLLTKHQNKIWFVDNKKRIPVPARPFITPPPQAMDTARREVIRTIKKFLRKKGYSEFGG